MTDEDVPEPVKKVRQHYKRPETEPDSESESEPTPVQKVRPPQSQVPKQRWVPVTDSEPEPEPESQPDQKVRPSQATNKRPGLKAHGKERNPACKRCDKGGKTCYKQVGFATACYGCAKIKMRCEPMSGDEPGPSVRAKRPAPNATQRPSKKRKTVFSKSQPAPASSRAPAPAPAPSSSRKKQYKTPETIESSEEERDVENLYGMFQSLLLIMIIHIRICRSSTR